MAQQTLGSFTPNTTTDMNLGHRVPQSFSGSGQYAGGLDEVGVYNRALSFGKLDGLLTVNGEGMNSVLGNRIGTKLDPPIPLANGGDGLVLENTISHSILDASSTGSRNTSPLDMAVAFNPADSSIGSRQLMSELDYLYRYDPKRNAYVGRAPGS